ERDHGYRVGPGVHRVERLAVGREDHGEGGGAGIPKATVMTVGPVVAVVLLVGSGQHAGRRTRIDLRDHRFLYRVDHHDLVRVVLGHEQPGPRRVEDHAKGVAVDLDAL